MTVTDLFLQSTTNRFRNEYLPRLQKVLNLLPEEDLWWYPHDDTTSVGNLLCHLEGNVRQWILSGLGGQPDHRNRSLEFSQREGGDTAELLTRLVETVEATCRVIDSMDESALLKTYSIQGCEPTGLEAIYHVLEHFGWHTGQIVWIAKLRAGEKHGLAFYENHKLNESHNQ